MNKGLRTRIAALEAQAPQRGLARVAFLDDAGRLLDDGSRSPWTGRTLAELKASLPPGWPLAVIGGIDPLVVTGLKKGRAA